MSDKLLHGKSGIKGIVGIECNGDTTELFVQDSDGNVTSVKKPHKYWLLSDTDPGKKWSRLKGDLHYKWGYQTPDYKDLQLKRSVLKHSHELYSVYNPEEACMMKDGYTFYRDLQPKDISLLSFDIETTGLDGNAPDAKILCISTTYRGKDRTFNHLFRYDEHDSEAEMLKWFFDHIREFNPTLLIGHNILSYDFPYIAARCKTLKVPFVIGRNDSEVKFNEYTSKFRIDGTRTQEYHQVSVYGREIVDTYFLASSFDVSKSIESYALKPMIKALGLEKEGRQYYDAGSIRENYLIPEEWDKICQYALDDAEDPVKLWDMMGPAKFYWCQKVPKPFTELLLSATGSQINSMLVRSYLQEGHSIPKADEAQKYQGAISLGVPGVFTNCIRWDVASLYPSIILEYDVYDVDKDPNANFLNIVGSLTKTRLEHKKLAKETGSKYYNDLQESEKIGINSAYGFLGASGLNFNCPEAAEFITTKGREILLKGILWATGMKDEEVMHLCNNQSIEVDDA